MKKRYLYRIAAVTIVCAILFMQMFGFSAMAASVYSRPQKHLYLVLDDSGSIDDRDDDANYALQTLIAMTDKTDTINIYFLNAGKNVYSNFQLSKKSNAMLDNIKVNYPKSYGGTPYDVVDAAQKDLRKAVTADDNGEYWLVVVTDGGFDKVDNMNYKDELLKFASSPMKNGKLPNLMCVPINSSPIIPKEDAVADNVYSLEGNDVIPSMNEAAKAISGRIEVSDKKVSSDGKTLSFSFPYPARNIVILTQNTQTKIVNSSAASKLNTTENYTVARPNPTPQLDKSTVCFLTEANGGSIAPGNVSVTFDKAINADNTVVVVEPAIGLMAHFYNQDGGECDPSQLRVGETAKLVYKICDPTTKKEIDESIINGNIKYYVDINGKRYNNNEFEFKVESDKLQLDMYAEFSDGFTLDIHNAFKDLKEFRIISMNLSAASFSADINSIKDTDVITATPTYNGKQFLNDEFNACSLNVKGSNNPFKIRVDIKGDPATGTYTISPKGGFLKVFTPVQQDIELEFVSDKGEIVTESIAIELTGTRNWAGIIIPLLIIGFLIWCIICCIFFKPRFPLDTRLYSYKIITYKKPVDIKNSQCKPKTLFHPGVLDFKSALPFIPGPFKINLNAVNKAYGDIQLVPAGDKVLVLNVNATKIEKKNARKKSQMVPDFLPLRSNQTPYPSRDFANKDTRFGGNVPSKYGDVLIFAESEFLQEQPHSKSTPKKLLRYVRKKTLRNNREI